MKTKVLQVFYGADALPYKDKERTVHFPIVGNAIQNANNTTQIKFYFDRLIEENEQATFVAVSKLPNGKIGSKILETYDDEELGEQYALLDLDSFYTQYKGDVFISLQGYQGGVRVEQDEQGIYQIYGTPVIAATGSIKLAINYAPSFVGSGETENVTLQQVLGELSTKLGVRQETLHVEELPLVGNPDVWYVVNDDEDDTSKANIYIWNATTQSYIWVGDNTLDLGDYYTQEQGDQFEQEIEQRVESVESALTSVASGSPKGVFATLSDLQTADPDHNYIYLVSGGDYAGHWFYYNVGTSAWTSGGLYQSSGIPLNYIEHTQLTKDVAQNFESVNMFDKTKIVNGGYFSSDGTIDTSNPNSQYCSQYIPVKYGITYSFTRTANTTVQFATYDANGNFIERIIISTGTPIATITFGQTVSYIRVSYYNTSFPNGFMFCEREKYPSEYEDYNLKLNADGLGERISDSNFDDVSENPVQNKVITNKFLDAHINIPVTELDGISEMVAGYGVDYGNDTRIVFNDSFQSYYIYAQKDLEIWVEGTISSYYSICVGTNPTGETTTENELKFGTDSCVRYRNTDNNLPTENNKLSVAKGSVIIFTFQNSVVYGICGVEKQFTIKQQQQENYKYTKTATALTIYTPKAQYIFKLVQNQSIRINTWRLWAGYLKRDDGTLFEMWENSDAEGVVRLNDEDDFIGGFHGDETMTAIKIYADGVEITNETSKTDYFDNISIYVNSDVYHCNTSSTPNVVAFKRSKQLNFYKEKVTISNYWVAQGQMEIQNTPLSLFQIYWKENDSEITTSYSVKPYYKLYTMQETAELTYPPSSELMTEVYIENKVHPVVFRVLDCNGSSKKGIVEGTYVSTQNRIKFYYYNISTVGTIINQDDVLYSQFEFEVK